MGNYTGQKGLLGYLNRWVWSDWSIHWFKSEKGKGTIEKECIR